jgi:hypothetical protein
VDLAAAYRLCHRYKFNEGVNNHLTVRILSFGAVRILSFCVVR